MTRPLPRVASAIALAASLVAPLCAHEDDPKILDRKPPVYSNGFRAASPGGFGGGWQNMGGGFTASGVSLLAWIPLNQIDNSASGNDCWGYVAPSGREYAIIGTSDGTAFFEISNPGNPVQVGYVSGPNSLWRDMKVYQQYCYIVSEGGSGIQVVNMGNIDNGSVNLVGSITTGGATSSHNVAIDTDAGFLYRLGGGSSLGLRIYDLGANPTNPPFVAQWTTRYVHDAQIVTYTTGPNAGRQIAYCCAGFNGGGTDTGLTVLDVTDKANIVQLGQHVTWPNRAYSHQGWLSEDRSYYYIGDELDENGVLPTTTYIADVSNVDNPTYVGSFTNGNQAIGHNMYTHDGLMYQANYTSGLRVFDISANATNPPEVAFFDTYGASDSDSFNGLWSCYPYFPSGVVIGSDLERGLFVWYAGDPQLDIQVVGGPPSQLSPNGDSVQVTIDEASPGLLAGGSATLHYDDGGGASQIGLVPLGGNLYRADFPPTACGTAIQWYVSADSTTGLTWTAPDGAPASFYTSIFAAGINTVVSHDMETAAGWIGGAAGDNASTGVWVRGNPIGTAAQPEDDHSEPGTNCWFTGQGSVGGSVGENDVDGGTTTLLSPVMDLSGLANPTIRYWRWYSNDEGGAANSDTFRIDISANGGSTWTNVEIVGPSGPEASGEWFEHGFQVSDFIALTANVQMRFQASDLASGSIVEAAIDDFVVIDVDCNTGLGTIYCDPAVNNSTNQPATILATGSDVATDNDLTLLAQSLPTNQFGYFIASETQAFIAGPSGSMGNLCVGGQIARFSNLIQNSGAAGSFSIIVDLTAIPANPAHTVVAGETWNFQAWYRDVVLIPTSNFTNAVSITFQ
jgi:choice-of-anchor B domain-containing protein